jgi:hypothetical protein
MYSLSKGKFSIPKVWNVNKLSITGNKLVENKNLLLQLHEKMVSST